MSDEEHEAEPILGTLADLGITEGLNSNDDPVIASPVSNSGADELRVRTLELWPDGRVTVHLCADMSSTQDLIFKIPQCDVSSILCSLVAHDDRGSDPPLCVVQSYSVPRSRLPPSPGGSPHHHHHHDHHPNYGVVDDDDDDVAIDVDLIHDVPDLPYSLYDTSVTGSVDYVSNGSRNHLGARNPQRESYPTSELLISSTYDGKGVISATYSIRRPSAAYEIVYRARVAHDSTADWRAIFVSMRASACVRNVAGVNLRAPEIILRSGCVHLPRRLARTNRRSRSFSRRSLSAGAGSEVPNNPDDPCNSSSENRLGLYHAEIDAERYQRGSVLATIKSVNLLSGGTAVLPLSDACVSVGVIHRYRSNFPVASRVVVVKNDGDGPLQAGVGLIVFDDSRRALPFEIPTLAPGEEAYSELTRTSGVAVRMAKAERGGQVVRTRLVGDVLTTWVACVRTLYFTIRNHERGHVELHLSFRCSGDDISAGTSTFVGRALHNGGEEDNAKVEVITPSHGAIRERCAVVHLQDGERKEIEIEESFLKSDSFNVKNVSTTRAVEELSRAGIDPAVIAELRTMVRLVRLLSSLHTISKELNAERAFTRSNQSASRSNGARNGVGNPPIVGANVCIDRGPSVSDGGTSTSGFDGHADWGEGPMYWSDRGRRLIAKLEHEERMKNLDEELDRLDVRIVDVETEMQETRDKIWRLLR